MNYHQIFVLESKNHGRTSLKCNHSCLPIRMTQLALLLVSVTGSLSTWGKIFSSIRMRTDFPDQEQTSSTRGVHSLGGMVYWVISIPVRGSSSGPDTSNHLFIHPALSC